MSFMGIIGAIIVGAIIGFVARLVLPGRQTISPVVTVILGILGGLVGSWLTHALLNSSNWILEFIVGVVVAVLLIIGYGLAVGRKQV